MSVQAFDPTSISLSPTAIAHIAGQLKLTQKDALHLFVEESGCNGYAIKLDYVSEIPTRVREFTFDHDVRLLIDEQDWEMVRGTHIDFVKEGLNSALKFDNPNADAVCGCGESFSLSGA